MDKDGFRTHVFVEGPNPLPKKFGKKGGTIFDSNLYPDVILRSDEGTKTAIELDYGSRGSKLKNALTKAGVLRLVGKF